MKRTLLWVAVLVSTAITTHVAIAGNAYYSLNLEFNDPADFSSGGIWTAVAKVDEFGLAGASMYLSGANFDEATGFLAPEEYAVQVAAEFGGIVLNVVIGDDFLGPPLLGVGVIGSSWPSDYVDDPYLMPYGGYPDLGSFTGGVALATGSFDPGTVPDWTVDLPSPGDVTGANLYDATGGAVAAESTLLTVRNAVPEPSAIVLLGLALTCAGALRRR